MCPVGFGGKFCSNKHPSCSSTTCQNGGTCSETPEGPVCSCKPGWTGVYCERTVDVSLSFNCPIITDVTSVMILLLPCLTFPSYPTCQYHSAMTNLDFFEVLFFLYLSRNVEENLVVLAPLVLTLIVVSHVFALVDTPDPPVTNKLIIVKQIINVLMVVHALTVLIALPVDVQLAMLAPGEIISHTSLAVNYLF